jgi:hypothetical protein
MWHDPTTMANTSRSSRVYHFNLKGKDARLFERVKAMQEQRLMTKFTNRQVVMFGLAEAKRVEAGLRAPILPPR